MNSYDPADWRRRYPNFTRDELQCRCGCGQLRLHPGFLDALQSLRSWFERPMTVSSGCRCRSYNVAVGGNSRSLHICDEAQHEGQQGTLAVDIATSDGAYRGDLYTLAWRHGFSVGEGRGFLHLDRRDMVGLRPTTFPY